MHTWISFFNLERLFGFVVYNLVLFGLLFLGHIFVVGIYGAELVWSAPQIYFPAK